MKIRHLLFLSIVFAFFSCSKNDITLPPYNPELNLENTLPVSDTVMRNMEGIYNLTAGNGKIGTQFVCRVSKRRVSFFSDVDGIYMILKYGLNPEDSSLQFAGFWRYSENANQGTIQFSIARDEGVSDLLLNGNADNLKLDGLFKDLDFYDRPLTLEFGRHFTQYAKDHPFAVFAHHGIQTTANPPYAENSINAVLNAEDYGVTGIEYDVRMTKDHVPICIHDASINTRLTLKGPLTGSYDQYNFSLLSDYIRLIDGQKIPSVAEVLDVFIESTNLKYVWLDIKGNTDIFKYLEPVIRNAYAKAHTMGRDSIVIMAGLPSDAVIDEFNKQPSFSAQPDPLPSLCELSLQKVIDTHSSFYGPRYTEGLLLDDVSQAHAMGVKVFSWTLNDRNLIHNYLENGHFDGFISDYPAFVVYDFYTLF